MNDRLAAHVASGEVGGRAEADVHRVEIESGRRRADRAEHRMRRLQRERLRAARDAHRPRRGEPRRRQRGLFEPDVHAEAAQLRGDQLLRLGVRRRPGDPAPPLIAGVAALARDGGQLLDVRLEMRRRRSGRTRPPTRAAATAGSSPRAGRSAGRRSDSARRAPSAAPRAPHRERREHRERPRAPREPCEPASLHFDEFDRDAIRPFDHRRARRCPTGESPRGTSRPRPSAARRSRRGSPCSAPSGRRSCRAC